MVEVKLGIRSVDLPYTIRIPDVSEEMFDELVDEDTRAELINGVMVVYSPASPRHDDVSGFVRTLMRCFADHRCLGRVLGPDSLVRLKTGRRFAPDLYFLGKKKAPAKLTKKQFEGTPDQVTEILSPSNWEDDMEDKRPAYKEALVPEIWLIDADDGKVFVDRKVGRDYESIVLTKGILESSVIPGFWLKLDWLCSQPMPSVMDCLRELLD